MKKNISKNMIKRENFLKTEIEQLLLKFLIYNQQIAIDKKLLPFYLKYIKWDRHSKTVIRNIRFITGRQRGIYRFCGLSRHKIRELASDGLIFGLRKKSW